MARARPASRLTSIVHRNNILQVNDSELALLALLGELRSASGYGLAVVARARAMERWAGLSASSIYKGLRRLLTQGLVTPAADQTKRGRGPAARLVTLTKLGATVVRRELTSGLAQAAEQSPRFRLSLAFVELVGARRAVAQLSRRDALFRARLRAVARARSSGEPAPASMGATLVFEYVRCSLEHERVTIARLIRALNRQRRP
jgi:DNA-binding PadR family transcriptional regulator